MISMSFKQRNGTWLLWFLGAGLLSLVGNLQCQLAEDGLAWKLTDKQLLLGQGADLAEHGDFGQAIRTWKKVEALCDKAKDRRGQAQVQLRMAEAYQYLGQLGQAAATLISCQLLAKKLNEPDLTLSVQCALGAELAGTNPERAAEILTEALKLARETGNTTARAVILNDLGNCQAGRGEYADAQNSYRQCVELADATAQPELQVKALLNAAAQAARDERDPRLSANLVEKAVAALKDLKPSHQSATLYLKAGQVEQVLLSAANQRGTEAGLFEGADGLFQQANALATKLGDGRSVSLALGHRGALYELKGRAQEALSLTQQALFAAQSCRATELLYRWEWQTGRIQRQSGNTEQAMSAYRRAAKTLESPELRHDILLATSGGGASGFRQYLGPMFYEFADLLLLGAERAQDRLAARKYLLEARSTIELLKSAELDDYFRDPCQTVARNKIREVDLVSPHTAVIYPIILPDRLELLISLPGGLLERTNASVAAAELNLVARELQDGLRRSTTSDFAAPARQLHHWLMDGLTPMMIEHQVDTLIFVPDGILRMIPLGSLFDGTNFLVAKYATAITPGLTLMDPQARSTQAARLLLNGLSEARMGYPALPNVEHEIQEVRTSFGGTVLTNQSFTARQMRNEFARAQYSIVHLATHAGFERDVSRSYFLTYDAKLSLDDLEGLLRPSQSRGRPVELLTLSACQTAVGDDRAALGLAGVAIKAGARSALATLWSVHDEASAKLVAAFYAELRRHPSLSKAKALQAAQVSLLNDPNYRHPYYWSPFLIIGNWL